MRYGDSGPFSAVRSDPIPRVQAAALSQVIHYSNAVSKVFLRTHIALCIIGLPADDLKVTHRLSVSMVNRWKPIELSSVSGPPLFALSVVVEAKQL